MLFPDKWCVSNHCRAENIAAMKEVSVIGMIARAKITVLTALLVFLAVAPAFPQTPFYQGKTITMIRGGAPGGVGEMRTRTVAKYLTKHVPGKPTVIIEFMPGG